ncbi:endocytosis defective- protein [Actinomortierella ambigua]|uniref:Endocytosis defective- protein n=1 Tax=Actinomortierella ambigua TaxID=1343610 RepID=A0A9P6Q1R3_9FUNG|nr:endocytosis defective- protein [Actinomortierella ambigua]
MDPNERNKYFEIFSSLGPQNGYISGAQARQVFMNSGLHVGLLGQIWEICDIDKDGNMDFDEFALAMRFIHAALNGEISEIPATLPPQFIPASKAQYFGGYVPPQPQGYQTSFTAAHNYDAISVLDATGASNTTLSDDFDWYIAPSDRSNYESIYRNNVQMSSGEVRMGQFEELYQALEIPREDINAAWALVNVNATPAIGKDQCITFFHILNQRRLGKRVPSTLPPTLRASFAGESNYSLAESITSGTAASRQQPGRPSVPLSFTTKSAFSSEKGNALAGDYLSRMTRKEQSEHEASTLEQQLKAELDSIRRQIEDAERKAQSTHGDTYLARKELAELLAFKQQMALQDDEASLERQLLDQERDVARQRDALKQLDRMVLELREQRGLLETHLEDSQSEIKECQREAEKVRLSRV